MVYKAKREGELLPPESLHLGSLDGWSFNTISLSPHTARSQGVFKRPTNDSGGKFALQRLKAMSWGGGRESRWTREPQHTDHIPIEILHERVLQQINVLSGIIV